MAVIGVLAHAKKDLAGGSLDELRRTLERQGVDSPVWREIVSPDEVPAAVAELVDLAVETLFVWGGDGTVQQCVDALGSAPLAVAVLPAGTANLLASNLGVPKDLEQAVAVGLSGRRRRLDVGTLNGERFTVMAGTGFDAVMVDTAEGALKERLGSLAYVAAGVAGVTRDPVQTRVEVDGRLWYEGPTTCVLVGNMGHVLGGLTVFPEASPADGRLNVGVLTAAGIVDWARIAGSTLTTGASSSPFVETTVAQMIEVTLAEEWPYEVDGDVRPETRRLLFRVEPAAIDVCVPAAEDGP